MKITDGIYAFLWRSYRENNCNTYLIDQDGYRVLIDPGHYHLIDHWERGLERLGLSRNDINLIIITHGHPDHLEGAAAFDGKAKVAIGETEYAWLRRYAPSWAPDILLHEGILRLGTIEMKIIESPGHSPASICIYLPDKEALFTGDVIFQEGIGRTDLPGGDGQKLKESIRKISQLKVKYLLPGHGNPVVGEKEVERNFHQVERYWFQFI
ncbi:MAG: MBL fold metallo-hydrolase [Syntrophales bacterium]|nr:MBL fold metallo-hydrolase [Syntrophales bacterium]